jgi:hypothetical protein
MRAAACASRRSRCSPLVRQRARRWPTARTSKNPITSDNPTGEFAVKTKSGSLIVSAPTDAYRRPKRSRRTGDSDRENLGHRCCRSLSVRNLPRPATCHSILPAADHRRGSARSPVPASRNADSVQCRSPRDGVRRWLRRNRDRVQVSCSSPAKPPEVLG